MWRIRSVVAVMLVMSMLTACQIKDIQVQEPDTESNQIEGSLNQIAESYRTIYEKAYDNKTIGTIEVEKDILSCLGKQGYAAVDNDNQCDMVNADQVETFCEKVAQKKRGKVTILVIGTDGRLIRDDFRTSDGNVTIHRCSLGWNGKETQINEPEEFDAYQWNYTKNGYLFFEQYHPSGFDGPSGHKAIRVRPLDETCRDYNRKYVLPIGYIANNMLTTDWSEDDYADLNFYDLFEVLYPIRFQKEVPYESDFNGIEYEVPKDELEQVIQTRFDIDPVILQKKTVYHADQKTYRYRPRGLGDSECPAEPYPEVTDYTMQDDGTVKLTIQAIWEFENRDDAFSSELVVRPMQDGNWQYVSNQVIRTKTSVDPSAWYEKRFTDDEWNAYYNNGETK